MARKGHLNSQCHAAPTSLRKLLPERDGELQYRIKDAAEDHERVAGESELAPL